MKTTVPNSTLAKACMILCVLLCVRTTAAAQGRTPARGVTGPADPCSVSRPAPAPAAAPSGSAVSMAKLMSRIRNQAKGAETPNAVPHSGNATRAGIELDGSLSQELWSSRVEAPATHPEAESSLALKRLIRQVRSVKFEDRNPGPTFTAPTEPEPVVQAPATQIVPANATRPAAAAASSAPDPAAALSAKAQKTLEVLQQNPDQVRDPLEVAELLFLSGRATEAAPFYAKALDQISRLDPSYDADRAWILFQLGNCLRDTDGARAQEVYMKLVSEYPASPWTELAKAHGRLLTWYQKSRPEQLATSPQL